MPRGFSGSGHEVSKLTAVPRIFVSNITDSSVDLRWANRTPIVPFDPVRTGVLIFASTTQILSKDASPTMSLGDVNSAQLTELDANTQYWIFIRNVYGIQVSDDCFTDVITADTVTKPDAIADLNHSSDYYTSTVLTWDTQTGDYDGVRFEISVYDTIFLYSFTIDHTTKTNSLVVDNLTPNHSISVTATVYKGIVDSDPTELVKFALPTVGALAISVTDTTSDSITIDLTTMIYLQGQDRYLYGFDTSAWQPNPQPLPNQTAISSEVSPNDIVISGLDSETKYYIYSNMELNYTDHETGEPVTYIGLDDVLDATTTAPVPPAMPTGLNVSDIDYTSFNMNWTNPADGTFDKVTVFYNMTIDSSNYYATSVDITDGSDTLLIENVPAMKEGGNVVVYLSMIAYMGVLASGETDGITGVPLALKAPTITVVSYTSDTISVSVERDNTVGSSMLFLGESTNGTLTPPFIPPLDMFDTTVDSATIPTTPFAGLSASTTYYFYATEYATYTDLNTQLPVTVYSDWYSANQQTDAESIPQ
jgi:hypothetical protein